MAARRTPKKHHWDKHIDKRLPILLTWSRIGLIPALIVVFYLPFWWSPMLSALVFAIAAVTDWLDGYLARRWNVTTAFGAFLDPVADKLLVAVALVLVVQANPTALMAVLAAVIIGREITISALREWMAGIGERTTVKVAMLGKFKTGAQMIALTLLLYNQPLFGLPTHDIGVALLSLAVVLTLWSMILYLRAAWPYMQN
jgi:CDP-diacylglycerol--glycerol-3-phosphate 3-phosphatidyltransferase